MNFVVAFFCTFILCWITVPTFLFFLGAINFYTTVMEGRCKVYILFGRVVGVITEPGLHLLWLYHPDRHINPVGRSGRRQHGSRDRRRGN